MPSAFLCFYTGTGNSARVADRIEDRLKEAGYEIEKELSNISACELAVIVFPVHACSLPIRMGRFLHRFPLGKSKIALFAVYGEVDEKGTLPGHEGASLSDAAWILRKKGYRVSYADAIGYPVNITAMFDTPEEKNEIILRADGKLEEKINRMLSEEEYLKPCHPLIKLFSWPFGILFSLVGRRAMGKLYVADSSCIGCGACVSSCPAGAIKLVRGKPRWNFQCEGCMRCINLCPKSAIQTSFIRLAAVLALMVLPLEQWSRPLAPHPLLRIGLSLLMLIFFAFFLDEAFFLLQLLPTRRLFEFNHTKTFRRYLAPGFKPMSKK
ncbi:MAG TPA: hypothetical protein DD435_02085 [Cyanobacteria bacterium UBA8530]|nr:hypothetical protein [Cyanobacteria bacterium UBA8530]